MNQFRKPLLTVREMTTIAILGAVSSVLFLIEFVVVPSVPIYKLDISNLPVLLGSFAMGPLAGVVILAIKSMAGLLHSSSQGVGEMADFVVGFCMVLPAAIIYQRRKSRGGAILGMGVGTLAATVVAVVANLYILIPFYCALGGWAVADVVSMGQRLIPSLDSLWKFVLYITAPFNLLKWLIISSLGTLLYKPLSPLLHGHLGSVGKLFRGNRVS